MIRKQSPPAVGERRNSVNNNGLLVRVALVIAVGTMIGALITTWQEVNHGVAVVRVPVGTDFATFHGAAALIADGNGDAVYTPEELGTKIAETTSYEPKETQLYGHPPFFPLLFVPLALLPFVPAYALFVVAGLAAVGWAVARVGEVRPLHAVAIALISTSGFATVQLGQMGFWVSALLFATYLAQRRGHLFTAGLLLGLLAFKPFYAAGVGVWWLLGGKRYLNALAGAVCSALGLILMGFLLPGGWSGYLGVFRDTGDEFLSAVARSGFAVLDMLTKLLGGSAVATGLWLAAAAATLVVLRQVTILLDHHLEPLFALAVVVGLLLAPRTGWYDWVLLVVPGVLLWKTGFEQRSNLVVAGAALLIVAALSWPLARLLDRTTGIYLQIAPIALAAITWWWFAGYVRQVRVEGVSDSVKSDA